MHSHALRLAVRAGRDPRQEGDRGRHGQLGDGHRQRAVRAVDGRDALRLRAARGVGAAEVPQRPAGRQGDGAAGHPPRTSALAASRELIRRPGRQHERLRAARAGPRAAVRAPVGVGGLPDQGPVSATSTCCRRSSGSTAHGVAVHRWVAVEQADVIICATGYEMTFPFFGSPTSRCTPTTTTATRCSSG